MGLDTVEMIMALEKAFRVTLPEEELGPIRTVGDLYDCLLRHLPPDQVPARGGSYTGALWERYIDVIETETGADRHRLAPTAAFAYDLGLY